MNNRVTRDTIKSRFDENNLKYAEISLDDGNTMFVTEHGGRAIGPFDPVTGECLMWLSAAFNSAELFKERMEQKRMSFGGERLWIAPELNFYTTERMKFDETYHSQPEIDPGSYSLLNTANGVYLKMFVDAKTYEMPFDSKQFSVERKIVSIDNPFRFMPNINSLMEGVSHAGYRQEIIMEDMSPEKPMYLEPWLVMQVNPYGEVIIPYLGTFTYDDYYEPIAGCDIQSLHNGYALLKGTGDRKFKVGYKASNTTGRSGYLTQLDEERYLLIVKSFYNDPSTPYCMEGWQVPGVRGCSLYIYNDDGARAGAGGFVEFEHCGLTIGLDSGREKSSSETCHHFFIGSKESLVKIMYELLGIEYS